MARLLRKASSHTRKQMVSRSKAVALEKMVGLYRKRTCGERQGGAGAGPAGQMHVAGDTRAALWGCSEGVEGLVKGIRGLQQCCINRVVKPGTACSSAPALCQQDGYSSCWLIQQVRCTSVAPANLGTTGTTN